MASRVLRRLRENWFWWQVYGYLAVVLGALITALALDWFTIPNRIAAGGVSGLATVLHYLFGLPVGLTMLALNVPLFLAAVRVLGGQFGLKTLIGAVTLSLFVDGLAPILRPLTNNALLAALYGGVLSGVGLGITFKWGGSTGGTDLAALLLNRYTKRGVGQSLMAIDFGIIAAAGIVFGAELALYALITLFLTSKAIDVVQEGVAYAKAAYIISDPADVIGRRVLVDLSRGATAVQGRGLYTNEERPVLFVIVARAEISDLKRIVHSVDPKAFVVITEAHEVLGEGFKGIRPYNVK